MQMDRLSLVLRGVAEPIEENVMTMNELRELLSSGRKLTTYVGYEPSGPIHLGAVSTIIKLAEMIEAGIDAIALMADVHAVLNRKGPEDVIRRLCETYYKEVFHIIGSPQIKIVIGSDYQLSQDYVMDLLYISTKVTSRRSWRAMSIIARESRNPYVSQMIYPLMQALDILYLGVDIAIGGTDQRKIHALAREIFSKNLDLKVRRYVPVAIHTEISPGLLEGEKMSKSKPQTHIAVHDPPDIIKEKIKAAFCPPGRNQYDEEGNLINPVLSIYRDIILRGNRKAELKLSRKAGGGTVEVSSYKELERLYMDGMIHPADLKEFASDFLIEFLEPIRDKFESDPDLIKPLYELQKWQREEGIFGDQEWKIVLSSMRPYLGDKLTE